MSGHSHWAGIKRKKERVDAKRGQVFSRMAKLVTTAARLGGGDPSGNIRLAFAIEQARAVNMPKESIERAIKKGTGQLGAGQRPEDVVYEGYGPGGVAILIEACTDNRNRTSAEMRHILEKAGGSLGGSGSVAWMFEKKGLFIIERGKAAEDRITEVAVEHGAEDLETVGDTYQVTCAPQDFAAVRNALQAAGIPLDSAEITYIPKTTQKVDTATGERIVQLLERLEEHDDVQNVTANVELPEEMLAHAQ